MNDIVNSDLSQRLTADAIFDIAGDTFFVRGEGYYADGAVEDLIESRGVIKASVIGTHDYRVKIWVSNDELDYACSCPVGQDGLFCKHLVATGLTWLEDQQDETPGKGKTTKKEKKSKPSDIFANLRGYLDSLDKTQLINLIIEQAEENTDFRRALSATVLAKLPAAGQQLSAHKEFIREAIQVRDYVDYRGMYRYLQRVGPALDLIAQLYEGKHFEQVIELTSYALDLGFNAYNEIDDSDGGFGGVLEGLADYHNQACHESKPDKKILAKSLFELQMRDGWGLIDFRRYAKALDKEGLEQFKILAMKLWKKVPQKNPGGQNDCDYSNYNITEVMQHLAELDGDIDAVIAIKKRDLSSAYRYFDIAETYSKAGLHDEALEWAEKGLKTFRNDPGNRLIEFLINEYQRRERHDKAIELAWQQFIQRPDLRYYQQLKTCADKAKAWEFWRKKAMQWLQTQYLPKLDNKKPSKPHWVSRDHSLLVEILLWEKDVEQALQVAKTGGCYESLWFSLAYACEEGHPADALKIYQDRIGRIIEQTNNKAYDQAAGILEKIKKLMKRLKQQRGFEEYVGGLRRDYKQKRNFIKRIGSF